MKKSLLIAAGLTMMVTLAGCPSDPTPGQPTTPSATPSPGETSSPDPTPSTDPTVAPTANPTPVPTPQQPLATPTPPVNQGFSLVSAVAVESKEKPFSYDYTIVGTGFGTAADYSYFQIEDSSATIKVVDNGAIKSNVEVQNVVITPTEIKFRWVPPFGAPTDQNLIKVNYLLSGESQKVSSTVRLAVPGDGV